MITGVGVAVGEQVLLVDVEVVVVVVLVVRGGCDGVNVGWLLPLLRACNCDRTSARLPTASGTFKQSARSDKAREGLCANVTYGCRRQQHFLPGLQTTQSIQYRSGIELD
jgi:hypothetical protein